MKSFKYFYAFVTLLFFSNGAMAQWSEWVKSPCYKGIYIRHTVSEQSNGKSKIILNFKNTYYERAYFDYVLTYNGSEQLMRGRTSLSANTQDEGAFVGSWTIVEPYKTKNLTFRIEKLKFVTDDWGNSNYYNCDL